MTAFNLLRSCRSVSRLRQTLAAGALVLAAGFAASGTASADAPTSAALSTLYSFSTSATNGQTLTGYAPQGVTAGPNGVLYALAQSGGPNSAGAVVKFQAGGTAPLVVHAFDTSTSGSSLLVGAAGTLYGTDPNGGANFSGAVYSLMPDGSQYAPLYSFSALDPNSGTNSDGSLPTGALLQESDGSIVGETQLGGTNGTGVVYKINSDGTGFTVLHSFGNGADGTYPGGGLIAGPDGSLYGVTEYGGLADDGTIFKIAPDGTGYTVLYQFTASDSLNSNADGAAPTAALTLGNDGLLYGVTPIGGASGSGVIFQLGTDGSNYTVLYAFSGTDGSNSNSDGAYPVASLVKGAEGNFYGMTASGGTAGQGTLFLLTGGGVLFNTLCSFDSTTGTGPALTFGSDGSLYGTTADGGVNGFGSLFHVSLHRPATHVLWNCTTGAASLWNYDALGITTQITYGPYPAWSAKAIADGPDDMTRVLWNNTDGTASLWSLNNATGVPTQYTYGPYSGLTAESISVGPDNTTHVLWNNANGQASLWNCSTSDGSFTQNMYGPYPGWTAQAIADGPDDMTRVLWTDTNGSASVWSLDNLSSAFTQYTYGPYPGWTAAGVTVGIDNTTHVLWNRTDGTMACWNYSTDSGFLSDNLYGPYPGWTAAAVADGSDALTRVLWTDTNGSASLWSLNTLSGYATQNTYGPYPGWTAQAISAGQ
jgi:uncharacterized repeat protein (TIGR03803 family)